ncbi:MAG: type IV pilin N-terminal domain-containing protein [Methanoregula sp.]
MPIPNRTPLKKDPSSAVSEIIGAILLISLVVSAVMIVGVFVFSQQTPEEIPNINFMTGTDGQGNLSLFHNGGDSLTIGEFSVNVDQTPRPYTLAETGSDWSLGKTLVVTGVPSGSHTVQIIYNNTESGGAVLLRTASANISMSTAGISPDVPPSVTPSSCISNCTNCSDPQVLIQNVLQNVSVIGDAINQSPETVGPVIADAAGAYSISYYREKQVDVVKNTYFTFNVTQSGTTILTVDSSPSVISIPVGDIVRVTQVQNNNGLFKIFGLGNKLWELSASGVCLEIKYPNSTTWYAEGCSSSSTTIYHTWVTGYRDYGSSLTLSSNPNGQPPATGLTMNSSVKINGMNGETIVVNNIRPIGIGLFVLEVDPTNANAAYFVGNAQSVTRDGIPVV